MTRMLSVEHRGFAGSGSAFVPALLVVWAVSCGLGDASSSRGAESSRTPAPAAAHPMHARLGPVARPAPTQGSGP
jgi:hypothetical protein